MEVMREVGVKNIVFSSSATVYGNPEINADHRGVPERTVHAIRMAGQNL